MSGTKKRPITTTRWLLAVAITVLAAACAPAPGGGSPTSTTTTPLPPLSDEPFTVIFIADPEARMRGNTNDEIAGYVQNIVSLGTETERYFAHEGGAHRIDPELVILGGDISADRGTSAAADLPVYQSLYDNGIAMIAGFGNHDWEPLFFSDGSAGYSVSGHESNQRTQSFTRESYRRSAELTTDFTYSAIGPTSTFGPVNFHANFRGVEIVNFNSFLYQPSYRYPDGWPLTCNLLLGGAGCQIFSSAEAQIDRMQARFRPDHTRTALFTQHYPLTTSDNWWSDYGTSGTTIAEKKQRLLGLMSQFDHSVLLAGHNHSPLVVDHAYEGRFLREYIAPHFGGNNGVDPSLGGGFLALLVSPTDGVLEVVTVPNATAFSAAAG